MRIEKDVLKKAKKVVNKLTDLVGPTLGPAGNKVIIGKETTSVLDDGVKIIQELELDDPVENHILRVIKEVAIKTNDKVGDGTTSSLVLLKGILNEAKGDTKILAEELKKGLQEAIGQIKDKSKQIKTKQDLENVARVSFDDPKMAKLLAEIVHKGTGEINVEQSLDYETTTEEIDGFKVNNGYISSYMTTERDQCILENPYILVSDMEFSNDIHIVPLLNKIVQSGRPIVMLTKSVEGEALTTLVMNKLHKKIKGVAISIYKDHEDLAAFVGANVLRQERGNFNIELTDLGQAKRVVVKRDQTLIIGGKGKVDKFTGKTTIIKVGADTDQEAQALRYKVEDASNAVLIAKKHGVVMGGGRTLASLQTSSPTLNRAMKYPQKQLIENLGEIEYNDSIIDPTSVVIAGLESAVSIACLLITTTGIIVNDNNQAKNGFSKSS